LLFLTLFLKEQGEVKKSTNVQREASLPQNYQAEERKGRVASELPAACSQCCLFCRGLLLSQERQQSAVMNASSPVLVRISREYQE
jgi:hypothetical protein